MSESELSSRGQAAHRNLAGLRALADGVQGLVLAAIAGPTVGTGVGTGDRSLPPEGSSAAAIAVLPGVAVWAWRVHEAPEGIARDLANARAALGEGTRAVLVVRPRARVLFPPLEGEVGAAVFGVDAVPLVRAVGALAEDQIVRGVDLPWSDAAEEIVSRAGFTAPATSL